MNPRRALGALIAGAVSVALLFVAPSATAATCQPGPGAYCQSMDLSGRNLDGLDLTNINLLYANLTGASLKGANLTGAQLNGANLTDANLSQARLVGVVANGANFLRSSLVQARVSGTFTEARFQNVTGTQADFSGAHLHGANFNGSNLNGANLNDVTGAGAHFSSVLLQHATMVRADLPNVHLTGSQFDNTDLTGATLRNATASVANFGYANLTAVQASGAYFRGANFFSAKVHRTSFMSADLVNTSFHGADFHQTNFQNAYIQGASFVPSNVGDDALARHFLFERVYAHVNAYGGSGSCSGSGSGVTDAVNCSGHNDDGNAAFVLGGPVSFGWGSQRTDGMRGFDIEASRSGQSIKLTGVADMGLSAFHVHVAIGAVDMAKVVPTTNHAPRGHVGGPLALNLTHRRELYAGYVMNVSGWMQRRDRAEGVGP